MSKNDIISEIEEKKELYSYQEKDINTIFDRLDNAPNNYHLLYQLPTGGGKTVIFSEIGAEVSGIWGTLVEVIVGVGLTASACSWGVRATFWVVSAWGAAWAV